MIAQAWNKCKYDRKLVKVSPQELNEALYVLQEKVYDAALNEPFLCLWGPLFFGANCVPVGCPEGTCRGPIAGLVRLPAFLLDVAG